MQRTKADKKRDTMICDWWYNERRMQSDNRGEQAIDEDYADGDQWSEEDKAILEDRGQAALVFNQIKPALEWVKGTERRTPVDWKIHGRKDGGQDDAQLKTDLMKYIQDANKAKHKRSQAFSDAATVGIGWLEYGIRDDPNDEPIFINVESWRNVWADHMYRQPDGSDMRYVFRSKIVDLDYAQAMFPKEKERLKNLAESNLRSWASDGLGDSGLYHDWGNQDTGHGQRLQVRLVECWYKQPTNVKRFMNGELKGQDFVDGDEQHQALKQLLEDDQISSLYDALSEEIRVCVFMDSNTSLYDNDGGIHVLQDAPSPYKHRRFPLVPLVAYRRGRDGMHYGLVRNSRDPQDDLNKRRSKALHLLATKQVIMDEGAVDDLDELAEEIASPDGIIVKAKGFELEIKDGAQLAQEHIQLEQINAQYIRETSGVTGENLGHETNATSGKAINARQEQGTVVTQTLFDNRPLHDQVAGEIILSLTEQFYSDARTIRIVGDRGNAKFVDLNAMDNETGEVMNDITARQADFVVDTQAYKSTSRQAQLDAFIDVIMKLPQEVSLNLLDFVAEQLDFAGKDEMVARIRKMNGQSDPDEVDEEKVAAQEEAEAEQAAKQQQMMEALQQLELRVKTAEAVLKENQAGKTYAEGVKTAQEGGAMAISDPGAANIGESILETGQAGAQA